MTAGVMDSTDKVIGALKTADSRGSGVPHKGCGEVPRECDVVRPAFDLHPLEAK